MEISQDCNTLFLTDCGVFPESESTMKIVVMPKTAREILELVENWRVENKRLRAVVNNSDIEWLARDLGFEIGAEGAGGASVRMTQGIVILVRRADQYLIKGDLSLDDLLEHFTFSLLVGA